MDSMRRALANWRKMIAVQQDADFSDRSVRKNIEKIEKNAEKALSRFKRDNPDSLFLDAKPTITRQMRYEYACIAQIAKAWGSCGTKYYQDEKILEIIIYSLEYMNENRYGQKELVGNGWKSVKSFNW